MALKYIEDPQVEAEEIAALRSAVGWETNLTKLKKLIGTTFLTVVCYDQLVLVGFIDVLSDGVDDALIRNLVVHPQYQKRGIGLKLLAIATTRIREARIKTTNVLFEPELESFYRKAGFKIIGGGIIDLEAERFDR